MSTEREENVALAERTLRWSIDTYQAMSTTEVGNLVAHIDTILASNHLVNRQIALFAALGLRLAKEAAHMEAELR